MSEDFTVGHSTHSVEHFMGLLKRPAMAAIADVRSKPSSRRNPQFNRDDLQETLGKRGIAYRVNEGAPPCRDFKRYS